MRDLQDEAQRHLEIHNLKQRLAETEILAVGVYDALLSTGRRLLPVVEERLEKLRRKHRETFAK